MSTRATASAGGGIGVFGILTLVFVLCKVFFVLLPLYGGFLLLLLFLAVVLLILTMVD